MSRTFGEKRSLFLSYIKSTYLPTIVYYPASGYDSLVKKVFNPTPVIHLSLPSDEPSHHYFEKLGDGIKILGTMDNSPLADKSVDVVWINLAGSIQINDEAIKDFERILKPNGIVVIEGINFYDRDDWQRRTKPFSSFIAVDLPDAFAPNQIVYAVSRPEDARENMMFVTSEDAMIAYVSSHKGYTGHELLFDYAVFKKE
jgi:hypothetical protein